MLSNEIIQKLKQVNISVDPEKTKQRVTDLWKSANNESRDTILEASGLTLASIQRVYKTGSISAKVVVAIAQTMNVSPFYLTGETDEQGECTNELALSLLEKNSYSNLIEEHTKEERKRKRQEKKDTNNVELSEVPSEPSEPQAEVINVIDTDQQEQVNQEQALAYTDSEDVPAQTEDAVPVVADEATDTPADLLIGTSDNIKLDEMTEEEVIILLRASFIRSKYIGGNNDSLNRIKLLLLS